MSRTPQQMGRASRRKGRSFENVVRGIFEQHGADVHHTIGGGRYRGQSADGVVIFPGSQAFTFQAKNHAILRVPEWLRELKEDVLVMNVPGLGIFIVQDIEKWIGLQK